MACGFEGTTHERLWLPELGSQSVLRDESVVRLRSLARSVRRVEVLELADATIIATPIQ
jgi:hypothetical protein